MHDEGTADRHELNRTGVYSVVVGRMVPTTPEVKSGTHDRGLSIPGNSASSFTVTPHLPLRSSPISGLKWPIHLNPLPSRTIYSTVHPHARTQAVTLRAALGSSQVPKHRLTTVHHDKPSRSDSQHDSGHFRDSLPAGRGEREGASSRQVF